jgi:hypothetical protein
MLKKYIIGLLILSILNFTACYSSEIMHKEDFEAGELKIDFSEELYITTKDSTRYHFLPPNFQIVNDTLYGKGTIEQFSQTIPFQGSIAIQDITSYEQSSLNTVATVGLSTGVIVIVAVVAIVAIGAAVVAAIFPN